jgi:outer membrane receptor protein involved in Fe transport
MITRRAASLCSVAAMLTAMALSSTTFAQTDIRSATSTTLKEDETVVLSPFIVNTSRDQGFVAASSLAGGRLAGDLKDTPVAYSVLTKEFIDALQLQDLTDMTRWTVNSGDTIVNGENYNIGNQPDIQLRGVTAIRQRNFFPFYSNFDSYNIERVDFARGPNAVLFGNGTVGGTSNITSKRARTNHRATELRAAYGSWNNLRLTLDHNQPLGDKLALRLNALWSDRDGWRDNDMERRKGATLAATWRVARHTEIWAEAERSRIEKAIITTHLDDNISGWDGVTVFHNRTDVVATPNKGVERAGTTFTYTPSATPGTLVNYQTWGLTQGGAVVTGTTSTGVPAGGTFVIGQTPNIANRSIIASLNVPDTLYDNAVAGSHFTVPSRKTSFFPTGPLYKMDGKNYSVGITQQIGEHFFLEVAGNVGTEDTESDVGISRSMTKVYIDINSRRPKLSAGTVGDAADASEWNPNFLRPYAGANLYPYYMTRETENARVALGYVTGKTRLGEWQFNAIGGISTDLYDQNTFQYMLKPSTNRLLSPFAAIKPKDWPTLSENRIYYRFYLTDSQRPLPMPDSWTVAHTNGLGLNGQGSTGSTAPIPAGLVRDYTNRAFNGVTNIRFSYAQAAASGKLFNGRLNLVGAYRIDEYKVDRDMIVWQNDLPDDWNGVTRHLLPKAPADWGALTYRERNAQGVAYGDPLPAIIRPRTTVNNIAVPDARYASDRFQDDFAPPIQKGTVKTYTAGSVVHATRNVSAFINFAQSFLPPNPNVKIDNTLFIQEPSEGWDYGVRFTFLDGGLVANLIRYEGKSEGRVASSNAFGPSFNAIIKANKWDDPTLGGMNQRGLNYLPSGYADTVSATTEGWELEIVANITKNWRLLLNGALPKGTQGSPNKESIGYFNANKEALKNAVIDAGGSFTGNVATFSAATPGGEGGTEGQSAVAAWNAIIAAKNSLMSGQELIGLYKYTANIYTDYTFSRGFLKGLRIGGGLNFRGKKSIGTRGADTIQNPDNPASAIDDPSVGPFDYVYTDGYTTSMLALNYSRRIGHKYKLDVDFKIDNLFDYDKPVYMNTHMRFADPNDLTNPGRVAVGNRFGWITPRSYTLTATLSF